MEGFISKSKKHIGFVIKFGGIYSSIASFLSDFFKPLLNTTIFCALLALIFFLFVSIFWTLQFCFPKFKEYNNIISEKTDGYWFTSIFISSIVCLFIFSLMAYFNYNKPDGYFATRSKVINNLQKDIGLINETLISIKEDTKEIVEKSKKIERHTEKIKDDTSNIKMEISKINEKAGNFKKETSDDPRKELANIGVSWNKYNFENCLSMQDNKCIKLFLQGGFNVNTTSNIGNKPILLNYFSQNSSDDNIAHMLFENGLDINKQIYKLSTLTVPQELYSLYQNKLFDNLFLQIENDNFSLADLIVFFGDSKNNDYLLFLKKQGANFDNILKLLIKLKYDAKYLCRELYYSKNNTKESFKIPDERFMLKNNEGRLYSQKELEKMKGDILADEILYGEICSDNIYKIYKSINEKINQLIKLDHKYKVINSEEEKKNEQMKRNMMPNKVGKFVMMGVDKEYE